MFFLISFSPYPFYLPYGCTHVTSTTFDLTHKNMMFHLVCVFNCFFRFLKCTLPVFRVKQSLFCCHSRSHGICSASQTFCFCSILFSEDWIGSYSDFVFQLNLIINKPICVLTIKKMKYPIILYLIVIFFKIH